MSGIRIVVAQRPERGQDLYTIIKFFLELSASRPRGKGPLTCRGHAALNCNATVTAWRTGPSTLCMGVAEKRQ